MDKYKSKFEERLANSKSHGNHQTHPEVLAQKAHTKGEFTDKVLDEFFDEANGDILVDICLEWLKTSPHETKTREYLWTTAMALGSVRERLMRQQQYGKNIPILKELEENNG